MRILGNVEEREAKTIKVLGCKSSLKDLVGKKFSIVGAIVENEERTSKDGEKFVTNYVKVLEHDSGEISWRKYTQTVISEQLIMLFDNEINDLDFELCYVESNSGNQYLTIFI